MRNDSATGLFDQAFSESVIDSFDFEADEWVYIKGGSSELSKKMVGKIKTQPTINARVTAIALERPGTGLIYSSPPKAESESKMVVRVSGESDLRYYDTVFNTASLACTQRMDLSGAELHAVVKDALRSLHYDASTKVAIKFKYPWWSTNCNITRGGSASTDMPLRVCVYPSYSVDDSYNLPSVLLCSYTWSQDAQRIGSLVKDTSPEGEAELKEMLIRQLAQLHAIPLGAQAMYEVISNAYVTHHAFEWYHDPNVSGAFALFGPGQFSHYYPHMTRPASDGKLHFVGEATSTHHAWVVGGLDSAYRAVLQFLIRFRKGKYIKKLRENWGEVGEIEGDLNGTVHLQAILGTLKPEEQVTVSNDYS
jgi:monoamine oxidase